MRSRATSWKLLHAQQYRHLQRHQCKWRPQISKNAESLIRPVISQQDVYVHWSFFGLKLLILALHRIEFQSNQNGEAMLDKKRCNCAHHLIIPVFVALIGITFLLNNINLLGNREAGIIWPSLLTLIGIWSIISPRCKCYNDHSHCNHCHHCLHDSSEKSDT